MKLALTIGDFRKDHKFGHGAIESMCSKQIAVDSYEIHDDTEVGLGQISDDCVVHCQKMQSLPLVIFITF